MGAPANSTSDHCLWILLLLVILGNVLAVERRSTTVDTTARLQALRQQMQSKGVQAYIVPSVDAHQSEFISEHDMRLKYISGFSGSRGTVVVTISKAALWTDGRYFLQAGQQLDGNWILQKEGQPGVPTIAGWIEQELSSNSKVGIDPFFITITSWHYYNRTLQAHSITLTAVDDDLIDKIWTKDRPAQKAGEIIALTMEFAGRTWQSKIKAVRDQIKTYSASALVLQKLDEIAWLFNLRGEDIKYNPVFYSYAIITASKVILLANKSQIESKDELRNHLRIGTCTNSPDNPCVTVLPYKDIVPEIKKLVTDPSAKIWIPSKSSYGIQRPVPQDKLYSHYSPISLPKSIKNAVEIQGMKNANIRDAVATIEFFHWAEQEVKKGSNSLTELSAAAKLEEFKSKQKYYKGLSFPTIGGFGPNGAVIHYMAAPETDRKITDQSLFLLDCGSQYLDGTTDTTRTVHFGTPTQHQKNMYTRVLKGNLEIAMATFPNATYGRVLDVLARLSLWHVGLDYRHGTGHGIGAYLNVHEGPQSIGTGFPRSAAEKPLMPGMFISDEPGYYEDGNFGVRIETVLQVVVKDTKYNFNSVTYIGFEAVALVPFQRKMIEVSLLTPRQIDYINAYNARIRQLVGAEIEAQNKPDYIYNWMLDETKPIDVTHSTAFSPSMSSLTLIISISFSFLLYNL